MTIMAAHFGITLGVWRLRLRIDIDEPRESELRDEPAAQPRVAPNAAPYADPPRTATWGRG
ncbi:MAG TPA: hypothetical protein VHS78_15530 [Candidatus Elarobacter sp.]|jgi:hypothetical protein|nr:hypothetical protein [Candidatus Elarobacter sp.]